MATITEPQRDDATTWDVPRNLRRFTPEEYAHIGELGVLQGNEKVELLEGFIVTMMIRRPPHDEAILNLDDAIRPICPSSYHLRFQMAVALQDSCPEPDCAIIRGPRQRKENRFPGPGEVEMVIEVSDSTLRMDRQLKSRVYARAGIPTYWIVNLIDRQIEVFTDPSGEGTEPSYRITRIFAENTSIPFMLGTELLATLPVGGILP